jgi:phosphoribosylanthranilate isomerase
VTVEIKFCGLTRSEDAAEAVSLGASYTGVIFAGGPRMLTPTRAAEVLADVPSSVRRVGVFAGQTADDIARTAKMAGLSVVQLHEPRSAAEIGAIRRTLGGAVWAVVRVANGQLPRQTGELVSAADAIVLDAYVPGLLGGTGVELPWEDLAQQLDDVRDSRPIVLAGGLRSENVARAIAAVSPNVVDVSSGVERAPGIKDHQRMRAFRDAVASASVHS